MEAGALTAPSSRLWGEAKTKRTSRRIENGRHTKAVASTRLPDYGKNGRLFEHAFWVLDEVSTVLGLATETMATGCLLEAAAFFLGSGSVAIGGLFGEFWAIGSGYAEASSEIAKEWVITGFSRGSRARGSWTQGDHYG